MGWSEDESQSGSGKPLEALESVAPPVVGSHGRERRRACRRRRPAQEGASSLITVRIVVPEKIVDTYTRNYDIVHLDKIVREKLRLEQEGSHRLKAKLDDLVDELKAPMLYRHQLEKIGEIEELTVLIEDIESGKRLEDYVEAATELIAGYKASSKEAEVVGFSNRETVIKDDDRGYYIERYLEVASKYMDICITRIPPPPMNCCSNCRTVLVEEVNEDGAVTCAGCGAIHQNPFSSTNSIETDRPGINTSEDDTLENFLRALDRYQGLQARPVDKVFDLLDAYFTKLGLPTGDEIKALPLDVNGRRGGTDHSMLYSALSKAGLSDYYEDANLIGHVYWGWTLPDISHLIPALAAMYIDTQRVFHSMPVETRNRSSSLSIPFRIWKSLAELGYVRPVSEFKVASNPDSLRVHNQLWERMLEGAGRRKSSTMERPVVGTRTETGSKTGAEATRRHRRRPACRKQKPVSRG